MHFSILFCRLLNQYLGEKTAAAAYHLLRGKRSGQTIQDVNYYHLKPYFGILPKLSKETFDELIRHLIDKGYIEKSEEDLVSLTHLGRKVMTESRDSYFDGWNYRGRESIFFARLSLIVQTLSHFKDGEKNFMPIQRDLDIQQFARAFLRQHPFRESSFSSQLKQEIEKALFKSNMTEEQKVIFTHRLVGHQLTGWTWEQLGQELEMHSFTVKLSFIESLHMLLNTIYSSEAFPLLKTIAHRIKIENHLTTSTNETKQLFDKGFKMEEIAAMRRLKISTIEDHFIEMALNDAFFPFDQFVREEDMIAVQQLSKEKNTKRLRLLKEAFPRLSYFQIRLILSAPLKGAEKDEHL